MLLNCAATDHCSLLTALLEVESRVNCGKSLNHRNVSSFDLEAWWGRKAFLLICFPPGGFVYPPGSWTSIWLLSQDRLGGVSPVQDNLFAGGFTRTPWRSFPRPQMCCHAACSALSVDLVELELCIERSEAPHSAAEQWFCRDWWNDPPLNEIHQPIVPIVLFSGGSRARFSSGIVEFWRFHSCSREVGDLIAKAALPNSPSQVRAKTQINLGFALCDQWVLLTTKFSIRTLGIVSVWTIQSIVFSSLKALNRQFTFNLSYTMSSFLAYENECFVVRVFRGSVFIRLDWLWSDQISNIYCWVIEFKPLRYSSPSSPSQNTVKALMIYAIFYAWKASRRE